MHKRFGRRFLGLAYVLFLNRIVVKNDVLEAFRPANHADLSRRRDSVRTR